MNARERYLETCSVNLRFEPISKMLRHGGYIPHIDHLVPPGVSLEDFAYYRTRLSDLVDQAGSV